MREKIKNIANFGLSKTEKFIGTDMKYLTKGSFWLTSSKIITAIASLITSIAFANLLSENDYGMYRYVLSFVSIFSIATLAGVDTALVKAMGQGFSGNFIPFLKEKIKWGLLGGLISLGFSIYYVINGNINLSISFVIIALFIPFMDSFYIYMFFLNGKKQYNLYTKYHTIMKIAVVITLLSTVFLTKNILTILFVYFAVHTLMRFIFLSITKIKNKFDSNELIDPKILSYGKHLTAMKVLGIISTSLDKILIFHYTGAISLAGYYLSMVPFKQAQGFLGSLHILALPKFSTDENQKTMKKTLPRKVLKSYLVIIPAIVAYFLIAEFAFELIYPKYTEFINISKIFMLLLIFFPISIFHTALTAMEKKKDLYKISTVTAISRMIALLILVPIFGLSGAVASILLSNTINALSILNSFRKIS